MQANFYPPIRLSQAFEDGNSSGGASGSEITRRSFLKRTGGATVAILVAWNMASQHARAVGEPVLSSFGTSGSWFITCIGVPEHLSDNWTDGAGTFRQLSAILSFLDPSNPQLGETRPAKIGFRITAKLETFAAPPVSDPVDQVLVVMQGVVGEDGSSVPIFLSALERQQKSDWVELANEHVSSALMLTSGFIGGAVSIWTDNFGAVIRYVLVPTPSTNQYGEPVSDIYGYSFFVHP